jgi:hypothetical protein
MRITTVKLFRKLGEDGLYIPSIVAYHKYKWLVTETETLEYKHFIYINLWLIQITHEWITK